MPIYMINSFLQEYAKIITARDNKNLAFEIARTFIIHVGPQSVIVNMVLQI